MPDEDDLTLIVDFGDEAVSIATDVEDRPLLNRIRSPIRLSYLGQIPPLGCSGDAKPAIKSLGCIRMLSSKRIELPLAYDMHSPLSLRIPMFA